MLLTWGAKVDQRNDRGQTPLGGVAFKGNYIRICKVLVEAGAKVSRQWWDALIMFLALFGRVDVVQYLQRSGCMQCFSNAFGYFRGKSSQNGSFYQKYLYM